MKKMCAALGFFGLIFYAHIAHGASSQWISSGETRMRLVVAEPAAGDKTVRAALQVELAPGWKTYWRDPGDAGVPLQLTLTDSKNVILKAIHYPAPLRFDDGVTVWAGYKEPVLFAIDLERGNPHTSSRLTADVFIGICENICVPFQDRLTLDFDDANTSNADQQTVARAFSALPAHANEAFGVRAMTLVGQNLRIETNVAPVTSIHATFAPDLFIAAHGGWQFGVPKMVLTHENSVIYEAKVFHRPKEFFSLSVPVNYTLVGKHMSVSGTSDFVR